MKYVSRNAKSLPVCFRLDKQLYVRLQATADKMGMTKAQIYTRLAEAWLDGTELSLPIPATVSAEDLNKAAIKVKVKAP